MSQSFYFLLHSLYLDILACKVSNFCGKLSICINRAGQLTTFLDDTIGNANTVIILEHTK